MGVILCRSSEASLIPNYIPGYELKRRRNLAAVILEQNPRDEDGRRPSPGGGEGVLICCLP